jgi:hypothetical protein
VTTLLLLALLSTDPVSAIADKHALIARARELRLAESREWRLLLHVSPWEDESEADAPTFFLSPEGKRDPWDYI